jgi:hypothetical protein
MKPGPICGQRAIICQAGLQFSPDFNNYLGCGVVATKLSRRQQQLQKHRPPHISATSSCFSKIKS